MQTSKLLASRASNYRLKSITSPSNHKSPFGWRDFRKDGKNGRKKWRENYFCGCLVREMREWNIGGVWFAFSPGPPKTNLSNLERKWERKEGLYCKGQFCPLFTLEVSSSSSSSFLFFSIFVNQNLHGQITNIFFFLPTFSTIHLGFFF